MSFRVIADAQNEEEGDEIDEKRDDLAKKMGNRRPPFFFPIQFPEVAIEKSDNERRAEKKENGPNVIPPIGLDTVEPHRGVKGEGQTEKLEEHAQGNASPPFEHSADGERREISRDENNHRDQRLLRLDKLQHQQRQSISRAPLATSAAVSARRRIKVGAIDPNRPGGCGEPPLPAF